MKVKPSSVTDMLYKLKFKEFIQWNPRKRVRLTIQGKIIAENLFYKYEIIKAFLIDILTIEKSKRVDEISGKLLHILNQEELIVINKLLLNGKDFKKNNQLS